IDAIKACDKASYCVYNDGFKKEGDWALNITSVITFGRIHLVEDEELSLKICSELTRKFTDDQVYLDKEITNSFKNVQCLEFVPEHMTGKLVNES
nr:pyridoxamine 5'-phosphate oxidase family protein [Lachnospiraceae bacterium]